MRLGTSDCCDRNRPVERHEAPIVLHREREQINVSELLRTKDVFAVDHSFIEE